MTPGITGLPIFAFKYYLQAVCSVRSKDDHIHCNAMIIKYAFRPTCNIINIQGEIYCF